MDSSPFSSRIGTNYSPTDKELVQIRNLLAEPAVKLATLQKDMDRIQDIYKDLARQHEALSHDIEGHQALLTSPIRRLPVYIIQEIFTRCLPTEHNPMMSCHESPVLLTRICSGWRHIALSTPTLWASIYIVIPSGMTLGVYPSSEAWDDWVASSLDVVNKRTAGVKEWLGRSGGCPLDITIYDRQQNRQTRFHLYDSFIDAIIGLSRRWRKATFDLPSAHLGRVIELAESDVPLLQSLTIRGPHVDNEYSGGLLPTSTFWMDSKIIRAPCLHDFSFSQFTEDPTKLPLKWSQMTSISLSDVFWGSPANMTLSKIAWLLESCPQLVSCHLEVTSVAGEIETYSGKTLIRLPHLRRLCIHSGRTDLSSFFESLDVPSLQHLKCHTCRYGPTAALLSLLPRTGTIRSLDIDPHFLSREDFLRCLQHCPRLTSVTIQTSYHIDDHISINRPSHEPPQILDDNFLNLLTTPDDHGNILAPHLEELECYNDAFFSDTGLLKFIKAKNSDMIGTARLKRISVAFARTQMNPIVEEIASLLKGGLQVRISYLC
ncbi:hypothetical protein BDZ97DRAFT_1675657 [Flammula alnicola]|nr:hypothetical protein BDZ97DRAFT_1675657 [Flammula alnicola]